MDFKALAIEAREKISCDTNRLILSSTKANIDSTRVVAEQIEIQKKIKDKIPEWYACPSLFYAGKLCAEQCSSQTTAQYKADIIKRLFTETGLQNTQTGLQNTDSQTHSKKPRIIDLTGGLGVDSYYIAQQSAHLTYIEQNQSLAEAAKYNFNQLHCTNIDVINANSETYLEQMKCRLTKGEQTHLFYIDPARRADIKGDIRIYGIEQCTPNLLTIKESLLKEAPYILAKLSPMADISRTIEQIPEITEVHVLSVANDCKELLVLIERPAEGTQFPKPQIFCTNFLNAKCSTTEPTSTQNFQFTLAEERNSFADSCLLQNFQQQGGYLYEPNASILKAGAFKILCCRYYVQKLEKNSHLYASTTYINDFPGRKFIVKDAIEFNNKNIATLKKSHLKCNIITRNFPLKAPELKKRLGADDGGKLFIIGTTIATDTTPQHILIKAELQT